MSLSPDEWRAAIENLVARYHVEDFHVTLFADPAADEPNAMVLAVFDVEHLETGHGFRFGLDIPNSLIPAIVVVFAKIAEELGFEITTVTKEDRSPWAPPPSDSPD